MIYLVRYKNMRHDNTHGDEDEQEHEYNERQRKKHDDDEDYYNDRPIEF